MHLHARATAPGHVTYAIPDEQARVLRRRPVPGLGRPHRPARRRLADAARSIRALLDALPARDAVYPGHMGVTTLGAERATNPFLAELAR